MNLNNIVIYYPLNSLGERDLLSSFPPSDHIKPDRSRSVDRTTERSVTGPVIRRCPDEYEYGVIIEWSDITPTHCLCHALYKVLPLGYFHMIIISGVITICHSAKKCYYTNSNHSFSLKGTSKAANHLIPVSRRLSRNWRIINYHSHHWGSDD